MSYYDDHRDEIEWQRELDGMGFPRYGIAQMVCVMNDCDWRGNPIEHTPPPEYVPRVKTPEENARITRALIEHFAQGDRINDVDLNCPHLQGIEAVRELNRQKAIADR